MQHKGLFVALCCGALCLTGCIKNIESESVTKIREATASKLLSEAELNKAQAEAAKIKANAEATIAEAQAKLIEAQAAKEEAQAKLVEAQAELQKINNEIAKVKLDEEREELKRKKAEVEKQIAEYEAAIAWAQASQAAAIQKMEDMANEAELNALKHQVEILQQKQNIVAEASKLNSDLRKRLIHVWDKYNDYSDKYYKAQAELILAQTRLARLEAGMDSNYEATVEAIVEKQNEIAFLELQVEDLESYITYSSEEIKEFLKAAEMTLADVKTEELAAKETEEFLKGQLQALVNEEDKYVYTQVWDPLVDFANDIVSGNDRYFGNMFAAPQEMEIGGRDFAGFAYKGQFFPLFTGNVVAEELVPDTDVETKVNGYELYPESVDGKKSANWEPIPDITAIPAYLSVENFEFLLDMVNSVIDDWEEEDIDWLYDPQNYSGYNWYINYYTEEIIPKLQARYSAYEEYVNAAAPEVIAAKEAMEEADELWDEKWAASRGAKQILDNYIADNYSPETVQEEMEAVENVVRAQHSFADAKEYLESSVEKLQELKSTVKLLTDAQFEADSIELRARVNKDTLGKKIADDGAIAKAFNKAKEDVIEARKGIADQEAEVEAKLAAYRQAVLDYIENPENDKRAAAKTALDGAEAELKVLNEALTPLLTALEEAEAKFKDAVKKYDEAKLAWDETIREKNAIAEKLAIAKDQLGHPKTETAEAEGAYATVVWAKDDFETAKANLKAAIDELEAAHVANPGEVSEEFIQLVNEYIDAVKENENATEAYYEAEAEYYAVFEKYPYYWEYYNQIDPDNAGWIYTPEIGSRPIQLYSQILWYNTVVADYENKLASQIEATHDYYDGLRAEYAAAEEALEIIKNNEDAYFEYVTTLQAAGEEYEEALKAYIDAKDATAEVEAEYKMLRDLDLLHMGIYVDITYDGDGNPVYVEHDITWVESVINSLKLQIAEKEAELDKLMAEAQLGKLIEIDGKKVTELEVYAMLVAKIERLESEINQYLALMDAYSAEIDIIMEAIESEADVD